MLAVARGRRRAGRPAAALERGPVALRRLLTALRLVGRRAAVALGRVGLGALGRRPVALVALAVGAAPPRRALPASRPTRRTSCAASATSSPGARRARASSPGRCGASSWAASARVAARGADRLPARRCARCSSPRARRSGRLAERLAAHLRRRPSERAALAERTAPRDLARARRDRRVGAGRPERRGARGRDSPTTCARCCATCSAATSTPTSSAGRRDPGEAVAGEPEPEPSRTRPSPAGPSPPRSSRRHRRGRRSPADPDADGRPPS